MPLVFLPDRDELLLWGCDLNVRRATAHLATIPAAREARRMAMAEDGDEGADPREDAE
jgi:hypothetical protein